MTETLFVFWAFVAGALSFFSPCCVAMLPAYVSFYVASDATGSRFKQSPRAVGLFVAGAVLFGLGLATSFQVLSGEAELGALQAVLLLVGALALAAAVSIMDRVGLRRALAFAGANVLGILTVFTLIGIPLAFLSTGLLTLENIGLAVEIVGIALIAAGILALMGRLPFVSTGVQAPRGRGFPSFFLFGVGYGVVAFGCNLPLLLIPIGSAVASGGFVAGVGAFVAYALGMGSLMLATTVSLSAGTGITRERIQSLQPLMGKITGVVLIIVGVYIVYYWQTTLAGP